MTAPDRYPWEKDAVWDNEEKCKRCPDCNEKLRYVDLYYVCSCGFSKKNPFSEKKKLQQFGGIKVGDIALVCPPFFQQDSENDCYCKVSGISFFPVGEYVFISCKVFGFKLVLERSSTKLLQLVKYPPTVFEMIQHNAELMELHNEGLRALDMSIEREDDGGA